MLQAEEKISDTNTSNLNLTLWCEYPKYAVPVTGMNDYFSHFINFIKNNNKNRIIFRVYDPGNFPIYQIVEGNDSTSEHGMFLNFIIHHALYPRPEVTGFYSMVDNKLERLGDIHFMFSAELAHEYFRYIVPKTKQLVRLPSNTFQTGLSTFMRLKGTNYSKDNGLINAFGFAGYSWEILTNFLERFGAMYGTKNFALFQFNLLPENWEDH